MSRKFKQIARGALVCATLVLLSACFGAGGNDDCAPGSSIACVCRDDRAGTRTCNDSGNYEACDCDGSDGGVGDGGTTCSAGRTVCDGVCVDTSNDPRYCGGCTNPCSLGEVCQSGGCVDGGDCRDVGCTGFSYCNSNDGNCVAGCIEDAQCGPGEVCDLVSHSCGCLAGLEQCAGECRDTSSDPDHCGQCDLSCGSNTSCQGSTCVCTGVLVDCGSGCVDTDTNAVHCGACDDPCDPTATCSGGRCVCPAPQVDCGGLCVDTAIDPSHCGGCNLPCTGAQVCENSTCEDPPDCRTDGCSGFTYCDPSNGQCLAGCDSDGQCASLERCNLTTHDCECDTGFTLCGNTCVNPDTDPLHCGGCNIGCPAPEVCVSGLCVDPNAACNGYDATGRANNCATSFCPGDMECVTVDLFSDPLCYDATPCGSSPTDRCCGAGEFCGVATGVFPGDAFCCVPGEVIPTAFFGSCGDGGFEIGCVTDSDCPATWGRGICSGGLCVECTSDASCTSAGAPRCELGSNTCVECLGSTDCGAPTPACIISTNTCVECTSDVHCGGGSPACLTSANVCVECTSNSHCPAAEPNCDTTNNTCGQCTSNGQCPASAPVCDGGNCVVCPSGTSCLDTVNGRRACIVTFGLPFNQCIADNQCPAPTICDTAPGGLVGLDCVYPCP